MRRALAAIVVAAALLPSDAALAQRTAPDARERAAPEFKARLGTLVRARCHMDSCGWFSLEKADYVGASEKGWLFDVTARRWRSEHPDGYDKRAPRKGGDEDTSWVFCSKTHAALIEKDGDGYRAAALAPGDRERLFGAIESAMIFYYAACHNTAVEDVYRAAGDLARRLGYPAKAPERELRVSAPEDALRW